MLPVIVVPLIGDRAGFAEPQLSTVKKVRLITARGNGCAEASPCKSVLASSIDLQRGYFNYQSASNDAYFPHNFAVCLEAQQGHPECWLPLHKPVDCRVLFENYLKQLQTYTPVFLPPKSIPQEQEAAFTLLGHMNVSNWYIDQMDYAPGATVPVWGKELVEQNIAQAVKRADSGSYGAAVKGVYGALGCYSITGLQGAVFGSASPWLEGVLLAFGKYKHQP